ncbi:MAG TPA: hypothetical protein VF532_00900 [Candidatus Angelobacter sp.]
MGEQKSGGELSGFLLFASRVQHKEGSQQKWKIQEPADLKEGLHPAKKRVSQEAEEVFCDETQNHEKRIGQGQHAESGLCSQPAPERQAGSGTNGAGQWLLRKLLGRFLDFCDHIVVRSYSFDPADQNEEYYKMIRDREKRSQKWTTLGTHESAGTNEEGPERR